MIDFALKLRQLERLAVNNSPLLLTAGGSAGVLLTAVLTAKATFRAADLLNEADDRVMESELPDPPPLLEGRDRVKLVWKEYIPPVLAGGVTIGMIVMANQIGTKRAAALAAAYAVLDRSFDDYREKVIEQLGANKEQKVRDAIAQDRVNEAAPLENKTVIISSGDVVCFDLFSGRTVTSTVEDIKKAMNDTNYQIINQGYASITDFYDRVGLPRVQSSDEMGWTADKLLELEFSTVFADDGRTPCVAFGFKTQPVRNYHRQY